MVIAEETNVADKFSVNYNKKCVSGRFEVITIEERKLTFKKREFNDVRERGIFYFNLSTILKLLAFKRLMTTLKS